MIDYIAIGPCPYDEECAQLYEPDYRKKATAECGRYIQLLREKFGSEPERSRLTTKWFSHDFGSYAEVVCYYDDEEKESVNYAFKVEEGLASWS